ncbi:MAG: IS110 family transposase [Limnoraphis robusta]
MSKSTITCHVLDSYPPGGVAKYWTKAVRQAKSNFPVFSAIPHKKYRSSKDFLTWLNEIKPDVVVIEPTGTYSRLWKNILDFCGISILWIGHMELKRYREGKSPRGHRKSDALDALMMACHPHDPENRSELGELNLEKYLKPQPDSILRLRDLILQQKHLTRVQSPIINYLRQRLSFEFPERALSRSQSEKFDPPLWAWLAQKFDNCSKSGQTEINNVYQESIAKELGTEISDYSRLHAKWLCDIALEEKRIKAQIKELLDLPEFKPYLEVFRLFQIGLICTATLLSRIYPFESFLVEGKPFIEYEYRMVNKRETSFEDGKVKVKFREGEVKRIKRNRSRDSFKMRLGRGSILEASGDAWVEKSSGSKICREALWLYVLDEIEKFKLDKYSSDLVSPQVRELVEYRNQLKSQTDNSGKPLLNGKHYQNKIMAKVTNMLFKELVIKFCQVSE